MVPLWPFEKEVTCLIIKFFIIEKSATPIDYWSFLSLSLFDIIEKTSYYRVVRPDCLYVDIIG